MMRFESIEQVLAHKFAGNFAADREAFAAFDEFQRRPGTSRDDQRKGEVYVALAGFGEVIDPPTDDELAAMYPAVEHPAVKAWRDERDAKLKALGLPPA